MTRACLSKTYRPPELDVLREIFELSKSGPVTWFRLFGLRSSPNTKFEHAVSLLIQQGLLELLMPTRRQSLRETTYAVTFEGWMELFGHDEIT